MFKRLVYLLLAVTASFCVGASPGLASSSFGFKNWEVSLTNANGTPDTQAGSHPYAETYTFELNNAPNSEGKPELAGGLEVKDLNVNLPPGVIGNPKAVPQCTRQQFDASPLPECPASSQIGFDEVGLGDTEKSRLLSEAFPVYNMVPPSGVPAEFAFNFNGIHGILDFAVRPGSEQYGLTAHVYNITQRDLVYNSFIVWGTPADPRHDFQRGCSGLSYQPGQEAHCLAPEGNVGAGVTPEPFLTLPTSCAGPLRFTVEANTWQDLNTTAEDGFETPAMTGCEHLGFGPSITAAPDTSHADTPAGLTAEVTVPQEGLSAAEGLAATDLQNTTVTLPAGVVINPGQATGLVACQPAEEALEESESPPSCPSASKVGTVSISTPLLPDKLEGDVYVLQSNPPHLQLLVAASADGVNLKLIGDVHLDETTGQLTTTFSGTPQLPFTKFQLAFSGGAQAALSTPLSCGVYTTTSDFTPWSSPFTADVFSDSAFAIESGADGSSACPSSPLPFAPSMIAGASTDQAGGYTDFSMLLQRGDGQQRIERLQFKTPEGLLGMISGVPLCGEPQAAQGTCSSASQIGNTVVEAGAGPYPLVVPQPGAPPAPIYLTGPYDGAPFGLSIVTPVIAGPFNLGTIITRASIAVDPNTSQITVTTDPLPQIVDGVPTDLRTIDAVIDRLGFMFNPTDCKPMSFSGTASSTQGASAQLSSPFQVGSCRSLAFAPDFKVSTSGKTSKADGASLDAKVIYPTGPLGASQASSQSNISYVKVDLPTQLPSRLTTLQKACLAATFEANPAACPVASRIGVVRASTPVLPVPLTGPVYFVSHGGEAFPSLEVVLQGDGVRVNLVAATFISKAGITSSTFKTVPDVPISSFELYLPEGPYSALAANGNLCKSKLTMPTEFVAQDGAVIHQSTPIAVTGCPKAKTATKKKKTKQKAKGKKARKASYRHGKTGGK